MRWLRRAALTSFGAAIGRKARGNIVVCLHSVRDHEQAHFEPNRELFITSGFLAEIVDVLRIAGTTIVPLDDLIRFVGDGRPGPYSAITFDDGYLDNAVTAFPVLDRLRAPFTVFVTPGYIDRKVPMWWVLLEKLIGTRGTVATRAGTLHTLSLNDKKIAFDILARQFRAARPTEIIEIASDLLDRNDCGHLHADIMAPAMDWGDARRLIRSGLVTIGCHTMSHPTLSNLARDEIRQEVCQARDRIRDELDTVPFHFAYPFGSAAEIEPDAPGIVREAGFVAGWTTRRNLLTDNDLRDPFRLPRVTLDGHYQDRAVLQAYLTGLPFALRDGIRRLGRSGSDRAAQRVPADP